MKKSSLLLAFLSLLLGVSAQPTFTVVFDSAKMTYPRDVVFNDAGDIFVCTMAWEWNNSHYNNSIYKFDESGTLLKTWWEKDTMMYGVECTRLMIVENELYLFGFFDAYSSHQVNPGIFMKKFDQELNELDSFTYFLNGEMHTGIFHVGRVKMHNDNFLYFSSVYGTGVEPPVTPFYLEIAKDGQLINAVFERESTDRMFCYDIKFKAENSGFMVFATERDALNIPFGLIYDYDINLENLTKYPLPYDFTHSFTAIPIDDKNVYLSGIYDLNCTNRQVGVLKMKSSGEVHNSYLFDPSTDSLSFTAHYNSLDQLSDGSLIMCSSYGLTIPYIPQIAQSWISLFKFSPDLELIWHRYIGGGANYEAYSMRVAPDDGIVICAGYSPVPPTSFNIKDLMVIKTDSDGLTTGVNQQNSDIKFTEAILLPNPAQNFVIVDFSLLYKTATLQLIDLAGRTILERALTSNHQQVDITGVPPGAYVYRIFNNKGLAESGKLLVE